MGLCYKIPCLNSCSKFLIKETSSLQLAHWIYLLSDAWRERHWDRCCCFHQVTWFLFVLLVVYTADCWLGDCLPDLCTVCLPYSFVIGTLVIIWDSVISYLSPLKVLFIYFYYSWIHEVLLLVYELSSPWCVQYSFWWSNVPGLATKSSLMLRSLSLLVSSYQWLNIFLFVGREIFQAHLVLEASNFPWSSGYFH